MLSFGKRPRELQWFHAGPMLFGDWGTSRLYVLGIAFVATGHGSLFYISWMAVLLLVVAWAYSVICRLHPEGGGVYSAAREISPLLGVLGGLLLFADYVVTAALSSLDAFHYLGVEDPRIWAIGSILVLGGIHYFGPKKAGIIALAIAGAAFAGYLIVAAFAAPHLKEAVLVVPKDTPGGHWRQLVHIVLALSGVEAVANMTAIMVQPVRRTALLAIWPVAIEVVLLNLVFGFAMNAAPESVVAGHEADMLRVLADYYVGPNFAAAVSWAFALLLLSAASTAMTGMLSILFSMARDGELPRGLGRLNRYGVPLGALVLAVGAPIVVLVVAGGISELAALYAIGVVGAIALNTFATAFTKIAGIRLLERWGLGLVALVMIAIWATLAYEKHDALLFAVIVLGSGLAARYAFRQYRLRVRPVEKAPFPAEAPRILVASRGDSWIVDRGFERAAETGAAVVVAMIRETAFVVGERAEATPDPGLDPEAARLFEYARRRAHDLNIPMRALYAISTAPMWILADHAVTLGCNEVHVGGSRRGRVEKILRGSPLAELRDLLPEEVHLEVHTVPTSPSPVSRRPKE